jgi:hypothetical protein
MSKGMENICPDVSIMNSICTVQGWRVQSLLPTPRLGIGLWVNFKVVPNLTNTHTVRTYHGDVGFEVVTPVVIKSTIFWDISLCSLLKDRLCGLVVRVSGYRSIGPEFDSRRFQIF